MAPVDPRHLPQHSQRGPAAVGSRARRPQGRGRHRRRSQRRSGDQPRRQADRVPVGADRLLDRSVHRGRGNRQGAAQADQHRHRPALLEPAVHLFSGRVGRDQPAHCHRHGYRRPRGARHLQRAIGRQRTRVPACADRRDLQSDVGARRQRDRIHRDEPRAHRPVGARSRHRTAAPADQRSVRRSAAGVVARRPPHRLRDRSVLVAPRRARDRSLPARADRSGRRTTGSRWRLHAREEHQPAVGGGLAFALLHLRSRRRVEPVSRHARRRRARS